jgi:hypothetical protein
LLDFIYYGRRLQIPSLPALSLPPITKKCGSFSGIYRTYPLGLTPPHLIGQWGTNPILEEVYKFKAKNVVKHYYQGGIITT